MHIPKSNKMRLNFIKLKIQRQAKNISFESEKTYSKRFSTSVVAAAVISSIAAFMPVAAQLDNENTLVPSNAIHNGLTGSDKQDIEHSTSQVYAEPNTVQEENNVIADNESDDITGMEDIDLVTNLVTPEEMKETSVSEDDITLDNKTIKELKEKNKTENQTNVASEGENVLATNKNETHEQAINKDNNGKDYSYVTSEVLLSLSREERIELFGEMAREDDKQTGIPASLTIAQALLESSYMESSLSTDYENYFGIKASSDGYNWEGSTWNGEIADMATGEEYDWGYTTIVAGFRCYDNVWDSIKDHSAYLLNNTKNNGESRRYPDIETYETAEEVAWMLEEGGYATDSSYAESLLELVARHDLTRFDYIPDQEETKNLENANKENNNNLDASTKTEKTQTVNSNSSKDAVNETKVQR